MHGLLRWNGMAHRVHPENSGHPRTRPMDGSIGFLWVVRSQFGPSRRWLSMTKGDTRLTTIQFSHRLRFKSNKLVWIRLTGQQGTPAGETKETICALHFNDTAQFSSKLGLVRYEFCSSGLSIGCCGLDFLAVLVGGHLWFSVRGSSSRAPG